MMNLFLEQVLIEFAESFVIMQVDQAGWHRCHSLIIPENIRLVLQPAHLPQLNPVEHVWEEVREKHFYNQVFESIDAVMDTLCHGLSNLIATPKKLASMTYFPHLRIVS
jgi:hypothetical protein